MRILLVSIGSRGDMEPFLAAGELLKAKGHTVEFSFPEQFRHLAEEMDCPFHTLGPEFYDLISTDEAKLAIGGTRSWYKKSKSYFLLSLWMMKTHRLMAQRQREIIDNGNYDRVLFHIKVVYPTLWAINHPGKTILLAPVPCIHTVPKTTKTTFGMEFPNLVNKFVYWSTRAGIIAFTKKAAKWVGMKASLKSIKKAFSNTATIYSISPSLFPRPKSWDKHLHVLGFHERDRMVKWSPDRQLQAFIDNHPKILFLTFGSMVNLDAKDRTEMFLTILKRHNIPTIINTAGGGLIKPESFDENLFFFVDNIPYEWIFKHVTCTIHHGGAGTTHSSLKYGVPTLIIPHIIDQFVWNNMVAHKKAGPRGIASKKLNAQNLEPLIIDLYANKTYRENAQKIADEMNREHFEEEFCKTVLDE